MDEGVPVALHVVSGAHPAIALVADLEDALDGAEALGAGGRLEDGLNELALADAHVVDAELGSLGAQLGDLHGGELLARERGLRNEVLATVAAPPLPVLAPSLPLLLRLLLLGGVLSRATALAAARRLGGALVGGRCLLGRLGCLGERLRRHGRGLGAGVRGVLRGLGHLVCRGLLGVSLARAAATATGGRSVGRGIGRSALLWRRGGRGRRGLCGRCVRWRGLALARAAAATLGGPRLACGLRRGAGLRLRGARCLHLCLRAATALGLGRGLLSGDRLGGNGSRFVRHVCLPLSFMLARTTTGGLCPGRAYVARSALDKLRTR